MAFPKSYLDSYWSLETQELNVAKTELSKVKGSPAKPILENRLRPVEISLDQSELRTTQKSDQSDEGESDKSDTEFTKILNSTENENKSDEKFSSKTPANISMLSSIKDPVQQTIRKLKVFCPMFQTDVS